MPEDNAKKVLGFVGAALAAYAFYKLLVEKKKPEEAIKESVGIVTGTASAVVTSAKRFVKGSPEAKEYMKKLSGMRKKKEFKKEKTEHPELSDKTVEHIVADHQKKKKHHKKGSAGGRATARLGKHKGHSTKKGLAQDQKLDSQEKHEKEYRKKK